MVAEAQRKMAMAQSPEERPSELLSETLRLIDDLMLEISEDRLPEVPKDRLPN
jgi:hypothetical protein